jgi:hypothetical protein
MAAALELGDEGEPLVPGDDRGSQQARQRLPRNHEHADLAEGSRNPWPTPTVPRTPPPAA